MLQSSSAWAMKVQVMCSSDWSGGVYTEEKVSMYSRPGLLEDMATSQCGEKWKASTGAATVCPMATWWVLVLDYFDIDIQYIFFVILGESP